MPFEPSARVRELQDRIGEFMQTHVYPNEARYFAQAEQLGPWSVLPVVEELKPLARAAGLWNLFLPDSQHGAGLSNLDYAPLCEIMGRARCWPPRSSTARHPTPATWKPSSDTAPNKTNATGSNHCYAVKSGQRLR